MITIPVKKCNKVNCNNLIDYRETYCEEHKHLSNQSKKDYDSMRYERDRKFVRFYNTKEWKQARDNAMQRYDYLCQDCLHEGKYTKADVVDHVIELKDDWDKRLDKNNLKPLCHYHHNIKTKKEIARRKQADKRPI